MRATRLFATGRPVGRPVVLAALWILLAGRSPAAPSVEARLQKTLVGVGETVSLDIVVSGSAEAEVKVELPPIPNVRITGPQTSRMSQMTFINGRQESSITTTLSYQITPLQAGQFTVPAFSVQVDGTKTTVGPLRFRAESSPQSASLRLRARIDRLDPFVQQPLTYRVAWYVADEVHGYELVIPALDEHTEFLAEEIPAPAGSRTQDLAVGRATHKAAVSRETLDGADYTVFTLSLRLYPLRPGEVTIPAPLVRARVQQGWETVPGFFFAERRPKLVTLTSVGEPIRMSVRALPAEGRPRGFTGAVGRYTMAVQASDSVARVGDPIRLTIRIRGSGLLSRVPRPDLGSLAEVSRDFSIVGTLEPGEIKADEVVFEEIVRPRHADVGSFPSIPFAYFDTGRGIYSTAWSDPVPLRVVAAPDIGPIQAFGAPDAAARSPSAAQAGLRAPYRGFRLAETPGSPWRPLGKVVAAPLVWGLLLGVMTARRLFTHDPRWARRGAVRQLDRRLARLRKQAGKAEDFYSSLAEICQALVAARLGVSPAEVTPHDLPRHIAGKLVDAASGERLARLLEEIDRARFSPGSEGTEAQTRLLDETRALLKTVRRP